jgi:molecular chaperone GrpE
MVKNMENETPDVGANVNSPSEVETLTAQLAELNDKYLRAAAELENTRRRAEIDAAATARNRAMSVARDFLVLVDAIVAAEKHDPENSGVAAMARAMEATLTQIGITKIESVGAALNPQIHNAIQVVESADAGPNTIVDEMQAGYMFGDTLLRPAMVVVAKM